jgi:hypothetical protein
MSLTTDPFTGNRYTFGAGNPISNIELDGHTACDAGYCPTQRQTNQVNQREQTAELNALEYAALQALNDTFKNSQPKTPSLKIAITDLNKAFNWFSGKVNNLLNAQIPSPAQWLAQWRAGWSSRYVTYTLSGATYVVTPRGTIFRIPNGYVSSPAWNGQGIVFRPKGSPVNSDANSIRIMQPNKRNPNGYFRVYNSEGQPLDQSGSPGNPAGARATHIDEFSPDDLPPGWEIEVPAP